jgi:transcriptional regulator with XRE-family HTH domain
MTTLEEWGAAIVVRRRELGLTQRDLAARADLTQQYLSLIERGAVEPRLDLRLRLASALEMTAESLFPYPAVPA